MLDYYRFKSVSDFFAQGKEEEARLELAQLQRRYIALCDENTTLKLQMQEFEDVLYLARNLVLEGNLYWLITGSIKQGPFCPNCYNRDGLLMRLSGEPGERFCSSCRESFIDNRSAHQEKTAVAAPDGSSGEGFISCMLPLNQSQKRAKIIPFGK